MSNIDADALERAANAVRKIEKSKHVKDVFRLSMAEQATRQLEEKRKTQEAIAQGKAYEKEIERTKWEEQRKTIEFNTKNKQQLMRQQNELARQRGEEEHEKARKRQEELVRLQLQAESKKQAMRRAADADIQAERRKSDEHRAKLERQNMAARIAAESEGRIREGRENRDIHEDQLRLKGELSRERLKDAINTTFENLGAGISSFLGDRKRITTTVLTLTAVAGGVYFMREGMRLGARVLEARLGTPALVRETSRTSRHYSWDKRVQRALGFLKEAESFTDVVLPKKLDTLVQRAVKATRHTRKNAAPYRHMMFYGPPGTGKTMVAKRLARTSGMEFAIMSGGDVGPLGADAVTQLHKLFDWSETSNRGVLLFIDEADAFLASRSKVNMSENQRNALNALLYRTGESSQKFMMVMATNRPEDLDTAVTDRVDESLLFDLPDVEGRKALLQVYFNKYILEAGKKSGFFAKSSAKIEVEDVDTEYLDAVAGRLEGFSGRGISKLLISVQGAVYGSESPVLTKELFEETLSWKLAEFHASQARYAAAGAATPASSGSTVTVEEV